MSANGLFLILTALTVTLPLLFASEVGSGSLRYLLTVPVTRRRLLAAKAVNVVSHAAAAVGIIGVVALIAAATLSACIR